MQISHILFPLFALAASDLHDRLQITELAGLSSVKVIRAAGAREQFLAAGDVLRVGDEVITSYGQIVSLEAYDGSKWKVAPNTRMKLELRKSEAQNLIHWIFHIFRGGIWGKVAKSAEDQDGFKGKVRTKNAVLGIRGAEYLFEGDEKRAAVDVLEGVVWLGKDSNFPPGSYKIIAAGFHGEVEPNGKNSIRESKPKKASLQEDYGLVLGANSQEKIFGTAEHCLARGKGWRSSDGSNIGECVDQAQ